MAYGKMYSTYLLFSLRIRSDTRRMNPVVRSLTSLHVPQSLINLRFNCDDRKRQIWYDGSVELMPEIKTEIQIRIYIEA
jgi:hypothetical protein